MNNFSDLLFEYLLAKGPEALIRAFNVPDYALARWAKGDALPPTQLQGQIIDFIRSEG